MKYSLEFYDKNSKIAVVESDLIHSILEHEHDFFEIIYVSSGQATHSYDNITKIISSGDILFIPPNIKHFIKPTKNNSSNKEFKIINIIFKESLINFDHNNFDSEPIYADDQEDVIELIQKIAHEYEMKNEFYEEILINQVRTLVLYLKRIKLSTKNFESKHEYKNEYVKKAAEYIEMNYAKKLYVQDIALQVGLSTRYMQKIFKEYAGISIVDYIVRTRVQRSCKLLLDTDKKVYDIAGCVGFAETKNFYTSFQKILGITPNEYRIQNSN